MDSEDPRSGPLSFVSPLSSLLKAKYGIAADEKAAESGEIYWQGIDNGEAVKERVMKCGERVPPFQKNPPFRPPLLALILVGGGDYPKFRMRAVTF
jgi:hypothetical protein